MKDQREVLYFVYPEGGIEKYPRATLSPTAKLGDPLDLQAFYNARGIGVYDNYWLAFGESERRKQGV